MCGPTVQALTCPSPGFAILRVLVMRTTALPPPPPQMVAQDRGLHRVGGEPKRKGTEGEQIVGKMGSEMTIPSAFMYPLPSVFATLCFLDLFVYERLLCRKKLFRHRQQSQSRPQLRRGGTIPQQQIVLQNSRTRRQPGTMATCAVFIVEFHEEKTYATKPVMSKGHFRRKQGSLQPRTTLRTQGVHWQVTIEKRRPTATCEKSDLLSLMMHQ